MEKILIVDDGRLKGELLKAILEDEYEVEIAPDGAQGLRIIKESRAEFAVILMDLVMSPVDGYTVMEIMKKQKWYETTPVIVVSGEKSIEAEKRCFMLGASDFIREPFDSFLLKSRIKNTADLCLYKRNLEKKVKEQTGMMQQQYKLLLRQADKLKSNNEKIMDILGTVVECRNLESGEHIRSVKAFTSILAEEMARCYPEYNLTKPVIEMIVSASALHDIGKITIPDSILLKPGKLTADEFEFMKSHAARGAEILAQVKGIWDEDYAKVCCDICRYHHERYDGRGYPDGLKGEEIPISAQIVSVADVYDALVSERVYKQAIPLDKAFQMIITGECGLFSPKILTCFRNVREQFEKQALLAAHKE